MSFAALTWARKQRVGNGIAKAVLVAIADRANDARQAWPSQDLLAEETEFSLRAVRDAMKLLEARGFLRRRKRGAKGRGRMADMLTLTEPHQALSPPEVIYRQDAPLNDLPAPHVDLPAPRAGEPIKNLYPSQEEHCPGGKVVALHAHTRGHGGSPPPARGTYGDDVFSVEARS